MLLAGLIRRILVLALVLAVPVAAGEFVARKLIGDAVTSAVRARIGVSPSVSLGSAPILLQLIHGHVDTATISARGARIDGLPPLTLTATLHDLHLANVTSLQGGIGSLSVQARLGPGAVRMLLAGAGCAQGLPADVRAALTPDPRVLLLPGRIDLLPPAGRSVEARLSPAAAGDQVVFALSGLERAGVPATPDALAAAASQLHCGRSLPKLPFGVTLTSARVQSGALALAFSGSNASFSALG